MRFGLAHRLAVDTLAALGLLALITGPDLSPIFRYSVLAAFAAALAIPSRWHATVWFRHLTTALPVGLLALQLYRWTTDQALLPLAVEFAGSLQVVRVATRRGAAHDQQILILALLHLIAGTVLGGGIVYGLAFLGFLLVTPPALLLSHLRREVEGNYRQGARDRTGLPVDVPRILRSRRVVGRSFLLFTCSLSIPIFLFTGLLFLLFPRVGLSLLLLDHTRPERMVGFSDRVDLGNVGRLRSDPTIALRVTPDSLPPNPPPRIALYLRGAAFDRYDGRTWSRTLSHRTRAPMHGDTLWLTPPRSDTPGRRYQITLEPIEPPVVFLPPKTLAVTLAPSAAALLTPPTTLWHGPEEELRYSAFDERGLRYVAHVSDDPVTPAPPLTPTQRLRYLDLPDRLTTRASDLARAWVGDETDPLRQARRVEHRLRVDYTYDLNSPSGATADPLDHFLFVSKRGHCEYYSTAMAVLLRALGVPSRNVTGFAGATYNRFGHFYAVRQGDAHSWVEAYIDGNGWTRFDPTPAAASLPRAPLSGLLAGLRDLLEAASQRYDRHVVGYDLYQQIWLLRALRHEYRSFERSSPLFQKATKPGKILPLVLGLALATVGALWLYLRRRRSNRPVAPSPPSPQSAALRRSVELYTALESSLHARGVPRPPETPPLAHATALHDMGHPTGPVALELTHVYLDARFGGAQLSDADYLAHLRVARALRDPKLDHSRPSPKPVPDTPSP